MQYPLSVSYYMPGADGQTDLAGPTDRDELIACRARLRQKKNLEIIMLFTEMFSRCLSSKFTSRLRICPVWFVKVSVVSGTQNVKIVTVNGVDATVTAYWPIHAHHYCSQQFILPYIHHLGKVTIAHCTMNEKQPHSCTKNWVLCSHFHIG